MVYITKGIEDRYERQDDSYNMFQYTRKSLVHYCLYLYTTKKHHDLFIVFKAVVHRFISYNN